jgi:beta-mannosidase
MELGGSWRAIPADESLRRTFPDPGLDDTGWASIPVPGHWRSSPPFQDSDGPLLYRRTFEGPSLSDGHTRAWLRFDGLFYQGDVWLDGSYLGDTEGYFFPHLFEVTAAVKDRAEHLLAIELTCSPPTDRTAKRNLTGVFQHWDCFDRDWNPGGIWRPVILETSGSVRIRRLRVVCLEATADRATLEFRAELDADQAAVCALHTTVARAENGAAPSGVASERAADHQLAAGPNKVAWRVSIDRPELWWPHALGDQPLYDVRVEARIGDTVSDVRRLRTGLRQVRMRDFVATINGERLFLKGANQGPNRRELGEASAPDLERDLVLAQQAGLDLLRVHGHISRPELYAAADRLGLLLWQDLPLQWGYRGIRRQAIRQSTEAVDLLGHHPSVAVWCGHNEPFAVDVDPSFYAGKKPDSRAGIPLATRARLATSQIFPTWNKTALDRSIRRTLQKADASRPIVAHSGIMPHPAWGTDSHLYFGWYHGDEHDLAALLARFPVLARFVSEFGAQAVPAAAEFCQPERWPDLDWPRLARVHALQKTIFEQRVDPAAYATFEAWRDATQAYQAELIRYHVETLRRLKYHPTGGFCQFCFADGQPAVSWSVLDHERNPKAGYEALASACAPVIIVADPPAPSYLPGDTVRLNLHVVSDLRVPIVGGRIRAQLTWPGGGRTWWFEGDVDADSCSRVGLLEAALPAAPVGQPSPPGQLTLDLDLDWPDGKAHNRYRSVVTSTP